MTSRRGVREKTMQLSNSSVVPILRINMFIPPP